MEGCIMISQVIEYWKSGAQIAWRDFMSVVSDKLLLTAWRSRHQREILEMNKT